MKHNGLEIALLTFFLFIYYSIIPQDLIPKNNEGNIRQREKNQSMREIPTRESEESEFDYQERQVLSPLISPASLHDCNGSISTTRHSVASSIPRLQIEGCTPSTGDEHSISIICSPPTPEHTPAKPLDEC